MNGLINIKESLIPNYVFDPYTKKKESSKKGTYNNWVPPANLNEFDEFFEIQLFIPGFEKESINLEFEDNILTISSSPFSNINEKKARKILNEIPNYSFKRSFSIKEELIRVNRISAKCELGILTITMPKKRNLRTFKTIEIE